MISGRSGWVMLMKAVVVVVALVCTGIGAAAVDTGNRDAEIDQFESICCELGLKDVDVLPAGVRPYVLHHPEQVRALVQGFRQQNHGPHGVVRLSSTEEETDLSALLTETFTETFYETETRTCINPITRTYFNLWADIWVVGSGSFWEITSAYERVGLTGLTYFVYLSGEWHYSRISGDRQSVLIRGGATLNYYLVFKTALKLYSEPIDLTDYFRL